MDSRAGPSSRFFVLENDYRGKHDTEFTFIDDTVGDNPPLCPQCGHIVGKLPCLPPYRAKLDLYGETLADVISGFGSVFLVTERFADAFRAENLMGLQGFQPVELVKVRRQRRGPKPSKVSPYLFVTTVYGSAAVDEAHSHIRRPGPITCDWCHAPGMDAVHGFAIDPASWNGDDIFLARGMPGTTVVSERFARFVAHHGFTHMRLSPTETFTWDPSAPRP